MTHEFPGFHVPGSPVFNGASPTTMGAGTFPDVFNVLDLAMGFGSRLWGHAPHLRLDERALAGAPGLGDLHTHELRETACTNLCERIGAELHEPADAWRALVLHTGSEAVETALKTALRATGRERMLAFEGAYHGTFGLALAVTHGAAFRAPWQAQLPGTVAWAEWGVVPALSHEVACVVVEPWLGRAGVVPPPEGFHALLREECDRVGALLVLDAVLCGAGRTGAALAEALQEARPDLLCLGKAIGGGVTASAVLARSEIAEAAWGPTSSGAPAHTSTSLGDPVSCAGILHAIEQLDSRGEELEEAGLEWHRTVLEIARSARLAPRGTGLLWALDTGHPGGGVDLATLLLADHRILVVPSGHDGSSITLYPTPLATGLERERLTAAISESLATR